MLFNMIIIMIITTMRIHTDNFSIKSTIIEIKGNLLTDLLTMAKTKLQQDSLNTQQVSDQSKHLLRAFAVHFMDRFVG